MRYTRELNGNFDEVLHFCEDAIKRGSMTATSEGGDDFDLGDTRIAVRVYERYSAFGSNRVSLNFTLAGNADRLHLTAITSGGSQAMFFKINTWGEERFLDTLIRAIENEYR